MDDLRASALLPQPRTPEPQRLPSRGLVRYPDSHISRSYHYEADPEAEEAVTCMYDEEGGIPHPQFSSGRCATVFDAYDDGTNVCTPRTVCQPLSRECPELQCSHSFSMSFHSAHASAAPVRTSPSSFVPSVNDAPVVRRARSMSCLSADRSVAPARCSVEFNAATGGAGQSIGRHTILVGCLTSASANVFETPSTSVVAHPPRSVHTDWTSEAYPVDKGLGNTTPQSRGNAGDRSSCVHQDLLGVYACATHPEVAISSVPRLTRLSLTSAGHSPAVQSNWSIGRPTTLLCGDANTDACSDWSTFQEEVEQRMEPKICDAQVFRHCSSEVPAILPCSHYTEKQQEEETLLVVPTYHHAGKPGINKGSTASSPPITWRSMPLSASFPASQLDFSGCAQNNAVLLSGAPMSSTQEELDDADGEVTRSITMPATDGVAFTKVDGSPTALEDAPRKSYMRSNCGTPPPSGFDHHDRGRHQRAKGGALGQGPTVGGVSLPVAVSDVYFEDLTAFAGINMASFGDGPSEAAVEWRESACTVTPQGRNMLVDVPCQLRKSLYSTSLAGDEKVASQLAQISIHASPTQKRLAFDEDELLERHSCGGSPALTSAVQFPTDDAGQSRPCNSTSAAEPCAGSLALGFKGRGTGDADGADKWWPSVFGGHAPRGPSGLQLLRSRKRCLAEMQATDTLARDGASPMARGSQHSHGGSCVPHTRVSDSGFVALFEKIGDGLEKSDGDSVGDGLKRQRREEERRRRLHCLLPTAPNTTDDLIPAPVLPVGSDGKPCSSALSSRSRGVFCATYLTPEQQFQRHFHSGDTVSWSEVSGISYVTPPSQSISMGLGGILTTLSQVPHGGAAVCSVGSESQVLTPFPTNVTPQSSLGKR